MFIGIAATIPDLANLPGQGGESITVTLDYPSSNVCYDGTTSPSDASPAGGVFSYTGSGTLDLNTGNGDIDANNSDPGSYTIIYTKSGVSSNFPIVIGNDITLSITPVPGATICTGDTATLTANASGGTGSFTYSWSTGATSPAIDVTASGTYTVTVTDGNGCTATASQAITASTAATTIASINNNNAMSFNGTDQYITFPEFSISNAFTLSCWINPDTVGAGFHAIVADKNVTNTYIRFGDAGSGTLIDVVISGNGSGGIARINSGATISTGSWQHLVVTRNSSNVVTIYHNGTAYTNQTPALPGTFTFSQIGKTGNSSVPSYFDGKMDEVAIFNTALSSCDIKGIYEGSIGSNAGKAANLLDANTTIPAPVYWNRMGDS